MKKTLLFVASFLAFSSFALESAIYGSLSSIEQLTVNTLMPGQFAYYENDSAIEMFAGSKDESKNLRVCDPAALSGYRIRDFDSELTVAPDSRMEINNDGEYVFTAKSSIPYDYEYIHCTEGVSTNLYTYCTYDGSTYTVVNLPNGTDLSGGQYYIKEPGWNLVITIYSKDSEIFKINFIESAREGGLGDMNQLSWSHKVIYDNRIATMNVRVKTHVGSSPSGRDWIKWSNFTAKTLAIGDRIHTTDLDKTKIYIYDSLSPAPANASPIRISRTGEIYPSGFDLYNLRSWAMHLYDGNRGEDWAKYTSKGNVTIGFGDIIKFSSTDISGSTNNYAIGSYNAEFAFMHGDYSWMKFVPHNAIESVVETNECVITDLAGFRAATEDPAIEFSFLYPVEPSRVVVLYRDELSYGYWRPINCTLTYNNAKTEYSALIPLAYSVNERGFWKIVVVPDPAYARVKIAATISVMASDGKYYKLTFPSGGGTVTATLDDIQ